MRAPARCRRRTRPVRPERFCDHANTHGIARRRSMPARLRRARVGSGASRCAGVRSRRSAWRRGSRPRNPRPRAPARGSGRARRRRAAWPARASAASRGSGGRGRSVARSTAPVVCSRLRSASARMPYLRWITSPCSVSRRHAVDRAARRGDHRAFGLAAAAAERSRRGHGRTRCACRLSRASAVSATCVRCSAQREARMPPSLALSE